MISNLSLPLFLNVAIISFCLIVRLLWLFGARLTKGGVRRRVKGSVGHFGELGKREFCVTQISKLIIDKDSYNITCCIEISSVNHIRLSKIKEFFSTEATRVLGIILLH